MKLTFAGGGLIVTAERGDPKYYGVHNGAGESRLLYAIKKQLNNQGYDLIKKRMWKDGHLVDDLQQYLRTRKPSGNPKKDIYIYNSAWAIRGAEEDLNKNGETTLSVVTGIFDQNEVGK